MNSFHTQIPQDMMEGKLICGVLVLFCIVCSQGRYLLVVISALVPDLSKLANTLYVSSINFNDVGDTNLG